MPLLVDHRPPSAIAGVTEKRSLRSGRRGPALWLLRLTLWLALTWFYTGGNGFPFYYHTDEPSKVSQILRGDRNFYHPQLLLVSTQGLLRLEGGARTPQNCVEAGRLVSALFAAGAVVLLGILGRQLSGPLAEIAIVVLVGGNPLLCELAHYMKEDTALLMGIAATLLAAAWLERRPGRTAALALGAAAGLATSGKYLGVSTLGAAAIFVWWLPGTRPARRLLCGLMLVGGVVAFGLVNWLVIAHPVDAWNGLVYEVSRIQDLSAHSESFVQGKYLHKLIRFTWPMPLLPAVAFVLGSARPNQAGRRTRWLGVLLWVGLFVIVLLMPRIKDRYLLPVLVLTAAGAAVALADGAAWIAARWGKKAGWACGLAGLLFTAALQAPVLSECWQDFHSDDHRDLAAFLRQNLPEDALLANDHHIMLTRAREAALDPANEVPQPAIAARRYLSDLGTLEDFQRWGVRYFIVSREDYGSVLNEPPSPRDPGLKPRCEAFYARLFASGKLLWERPPGLVRYLHPGLRVYYLPP